MNGTVSILNVGHGDTKLTFDKDNAAECIRAARIVKDMLRRGYALLVEVEQPDGTKKFQRAYDFIEGTCEYIIADMNVYVPSEQEATPDDNSSDDGIATELAASAASEAAATRPQPRGRKVRTKRVGASGTRAVAVARSAGG